MARILSFRDRGGDAAPRPGNLDEARALLSSISGRDNMDVVPPLRKLLKKHPDIAGAVAWLYARELRGNDRHVAGMVLGILVASDAFTAAARHRSAAAAAAEMDLALRDKSLGDDAKITLLPLLEMAGRPVPEEEAPRYFRDYGAAMTRLAEEFRQATTDSPAFLMKLLAAKGLVSEDMADAGKPPSVEDATDLVRVGLAVGPDNPAGATIMAMALAIRAGAPDFSAERALEHLATIRSLATPRARWCLEVLANWPGFAMPFRERAGRLAGELAAEVGESQPPPPEGKFSHALVSMVDGMGSRTATIFYRAHDGGMDACNLLLNDEVGVKEANALFRSGGMMEDMLRGGLEQMSVAEAPLSLVRDLLADAFVQHEELGTAPPGVLFALMPYLGGAAVAPRRREPDLSAYRPKDIPLTRDLAAGGGDLAQGAVYGCLFPASEEAYEFCRKNLGKRGAGLSDKAYEAFLREVMPLERDRLLKRMAVNLEVEALAGRADFPENQLAARLWLGIRDNVLPLWEMPFIRELARNAVGAIADDVRRGFRNQREAFAAEQEGGGPGSETDLLFDKLGVGDLSPADRERLFNELASTLFGGLEKQPRPRRKKAAKPKKKKPKRVWMLAEDARSKPKAKSAAGKAAGAARRRTLYRLSVELIGVPPTAEEFMEANPGIVREIEIAGDQTLDQLHRAVFSAFDREDMHAYEFQFAERPMAPGAKRYPHPQVAAVSGDDTDGLVRPATEVTLDELDLTAGKDFFYWFDFGDDWWHRVTVVEVGQTEPRRKYPRVSAKRGPSPPQYGE